MSWEVVLTASIKALIPHLLAWVVYLVTFKMEIICTRVPCCEVYMVMSWFIHVLMLCMSLVVAVPVSQLRASPRKGSRLLLWQLVVGGWLDWSSFTVDAMVDAAELYTSLILDSSS